QPRRGQDHHRSLAAVLQHREATLVAWIQATGTRGHHLACASKRSSTVICPGNSPKADHELRLKPDHPMGSGQWVRRNQPWTSGRWPSQFSAATTVRPLSGQGRVCLNVADGSAKQTPQLPGHNVCFCQTAHFSSASGMSAESGRKQPAYGCNTAFRQSLPRLVLQRIHSRLLTIRTET